MTTTLATALDALARAAEAAGLDPAAARNEGCLLAAAVAEPAVGAFADWARETGNEPGAEPFMAAAAAGRRWRSAPTPLVSELRARDQAKANAYAAALGDVCAAACALGQPTPQVAGAATMAAAAQRGLSPDTAPRQPDPTAPPQGPASDAPEPTGEPAPGPVAHDGRFPRTPAGDAPTEPGGQPSWASQARDFAARAPGLLNQVLGQLRESQQNLVKARDVDFGFPTPTLQPMPDPLALGDLDPHAPGAFDLTAVRDGGLPRPSGTPTGHDHPLDAGAPHPAGQPVQPTRDAAGAPGEQAAAATTATEPAAAAAAAEDHRTVEELLAELDGLVGLASVKTEIHKQAAVLKVEGLRKKAGLKSPTLTRHLIFVGNPGTGKTTVARLVAGIYRALGLLSKGQLIECDRSELVAGYLGQTAIKTSEMCDKAKGGVLFIDEAYALNGDQYGEEAINTLVKEMEDNRDDLVVIVAGYPAPMAEFIDNNPGLSSRFRTTIEFEDYSDDELVGILRGMAKAADYDLGDGVEAKFRTLLGRQLRDSTFGNGRFARNTMEAAIGRHAWRLRDEADPTLEELRTLKPEDIEEPADTVDWPPAATAGPGADAPAAAPAPEDAGPAAPQGPGARTTHDGEATNHPGPDA